MNVHAIEINQDTFAPARLSSISSLLNVAIPLILIIAAVLLLAMLMMGGIKMLQAGDSSENFQKVQELLFWAVLGFGLIAASFFLTKLIGFITNVAIPL
ncbi:MAG: hypothetical protein WBO77_05080 [Microgenomates group bacterium]